MKREWTKREAKGKSTKNQERTLATIDSRTEQLDQTMGDIDALGADQDHVYDLVSGDNQGNGKHGVTKGDDGVINIYGSNDGLHVHEIRHVSLSLSSAEGLVFNAKGDLTLALKLIMVQMMNMKDIELNGVILEVGMEQEKQDGM